MSVLTGEALATVKDMEDKEVADMCLRVLRELFQDQVKTPACVFIKEYLFQSFISSTILYVIIII